MVNVKKLFLTCAVLLLILCVTSSILAGVNVLKYVEIYSELSSRVKNRTSSDLLLISGVIVIVINVLTLLLTIAAMIFHYFHIRQIRMGAYQVINDEI